MRRQICAPPRSSESLQVLRQDCDFCRDVAVLSCVAGEPTVTEHEAEVVYEEETVGLVEELGVGSGVW